MRQLQCPIAAACTTAACATSCPCLSVPWPLQLDLGVFASGPLLQTQLLRDSGLAAGLETVPQLQVIEGTAPRLLQLARSTPGLLAALVGHKAPAHVEQNCALARVPPLSEPELRAAAAALGITALRGQMCALLAGLNVR